MYPRQFAAVLVLAATTAWGQASPAGTPPAGQPAVRASGDAVVHAKPDQVKIGIGVVTRAATAQQAASENAAQLQAVLAKLHAAVAGKGEIQTLGYSLTPVWNYPRDGKPSITGYTATNTVEVTSRDLSGIGQLLDAAAQAGANNIQGVQFTLQNDAPERAQALRQATLEARTNAESMAAALGMRLGPVLLVEQGTAAPIRPVFRAEAMAAPGAAPTPVEPGTIEVRATVTMTVALAK